MHNQNDIIVCLGGGPAGLTAAYELAKAGRKVIVLEADPVYVGGIARTVRYKGYGFDIGGHRFFSKSPEINVLWREVMGEELMTRPRRSRIYYGGKYYPYPLDLKATLANLGLVESLRCGLSYLHARLLPQANPQTFEQWVSNAFGKRLYGIFFKTYTEKVWGIPCTSISADWAAQRIKGLSLSAAALDALRRSFGIKSSGKVKSLIEEFYYPRLGPGMMWERFAEKIAALGGDVRLGCRVESLTQDAGGGWQVSYRQDGALCHIACTQVISTLPLRELMHMASAPQPVLEAGDSLHYRDFLIVALMLKDKRHLEDNWLYIHDPGVQVGRVQNFKAWSPDMVPDSETACYGMEYFCFEGDGLWSMEDSALANLATRELAAIGLASENEVVDSCVVRQPKAYPVYDEIYKQALGVIRPWLESQNGLQVAGRNGMHKYNNQDHSMMTGLLAARNILAGQKRWDVWNVNQDAEYHEEEASDAGGRQVPQTLTGTTRT